MLLYGPPGTGKTMLAKAVAHHTTASFIRVVGSEFVQKYLGEVRGHPGLGAVLCLSCWPSFFSTMGGSCSGSGGCIVGSQLPRSTWGGVGRPGLVVG